MRKHFLILMLFALLPLAGWAAAVTLPQPVADLVYDASYQELVVDGTAENDYFYALVPAGEDAPGWEAYSSANVPSAKNAGSYEVYYVDANEVTSDADVANASHFTVTIAKKELVYFLTGSTYAIGDEPDITRHYSLASGYTFEGTDKLSDYASFDFPTGSVTLDLDANRRFTKITQYNITALRVIEEANVVQNYDFRFTSTAVIVVTAKSIANFVYNAVPAQTYIGSKITFEGDDIPAIYATVADRDAQTPIALDPSNYDVSFGENINVAYDNNDDVTNGGTIIYTGKGNYEGTLTIPFVIQPRELTNVTVDELANITYAYGAEIVPELTGKVHGTGAELNKVYTLDPTKDFTVNYNNTNINAGNAVGTISVAKGNFTFATTVQKDDVEFTIDPKDLANEEITVTTQNASYPYTGAQIQPNFTVTWTIGQTANNITEFTQADWTANENVAVGKGYVTVVPKENADPQNYTGSKTVAFDIIPTDLVSAGVTITLQKKDPDYVPTQEQPESWIDATYQYEGREIKPGTPIDNELVDGRLLVKDGDLTLKEGVDYEIVSYGDDVTIGQNNYDGDNENASAIADTKGTVTIKGLGNYGAIDALSEPITLSQIFDINKRKLTFTATPVTTTFAVAPQFACTNDAVDDLGGQVTYPAAIQDNQTVQVAEFNGTEWGNWALYDGALDALVVTAATPVNGSMKYQYKPTWTATGEAPENPVEGVEYSTAEQIANRINYDIEHVEYKYGAITVNNAKWFIVPDDASKKYMVTDAALVAANKFTYKVYAGETLESATLVENPVFNNDCAPVIGRAQDAQGEDVKEGGYVISVLNADADITAEQAGIYGGAQSKVAKTGYTIVCETATLTINPFPITLTANNQTIYYGSEPNTGCDDDDWIRTVNNEGVEVDGNLLTVTFSPVMYGNQELIDREDLGLTLTLDESYDGKAKTHTGVLVPAISNPNFTLASEAIKGNVTVLVSDALILAQDDADLANKISAADDDKNHTISFKSLPMAGGKWHAMVLPFEVSLVDVVSKLGTYVVVNKIKSASMNDAKVGIEMNKIEAGVPFLIKPATDANWNQNAQAQAISFTAKVEKDVQPQDKTAAIFTGVYEMNKSLKWGYDLDGEADADAKYKWLNPALDAEGAWVRPKNNAHVLKPMEAYLQLAADASGARIFVEDFENGTTAIKSLSADEINGLKTSEGWYTINGIKLQSAPVEKGVYINNGKKVVIK